LAHGLIDGEQIADAFSGVVVDVYAEAAGKDGEEVADDSLTYNGAVYFCRG
jgi:hypothetical protein